MVTSRIAELRTQIDGKLVDRNRVIDHLLDFRLDAAGTPALEEKVDVLLANVPGLTVVESEWWVEALDEIEARANEAVPSAG